MAGKRCSHVGSRRRDSTFIAAPRVVKHGGLDDKAWCAEAALKRITSNKCFLYRMQSTSTDSFHGC
jgi:hypothetical protein